MEKIASKDMRIAELLEMDRNIAAILMQSGMHCLGCAMASSEDLDQACQVHGIDADVLIDDINAYLAAGGQ